MALVSYLYQTNYSHNTQYLQHCQEIPLLSFTISVGSKVNDENNLVHADFATGRADGVWGSGALLPPLQ